jgi:hypothetical protein
MTISDRGDGFGAQYQHIIFGLIYAEMNGKTYIHKPISSMEHNYDNSPDFIDEIEEFIGIRRHYVSLSPSIEGIEVIGFWTLYPFITENAERFNHCLTHSNNIIDKIRQIFWENKSNPFSNVETKTKTETNVAVHIRRPNPHDNRIEGADTPDEYYLRQIDKVRRTGVVFHIYSQNNLDQSKYVGEDIVFHIDENIRDTFLGLVSADILIMSNSALSYCAALLNIGTVYSMKPSSCFNPLRDNWIVVS